MKHLVRVLIIAIAMLIATAAWANKPVFQQIMDKVKQSAAVKTTKSTPTPTTPAAVKTTKSIPAQTTPAISKSKVPVVKKPVFAVIKELAKNKK